MSNTIQFLETLGRAPAVPGLDPGYEAAIAAFGLPEGERDALLQRDVPLLVARLHARASISCMLTTPDEAPSRSPDKREDEEEAPDREDVPTVPGDAAR